MVNRQDLKLDLDIAYFQAMSKIVQFGRSVYTNGPPFLSKILPIHSITQEVIQ